MAGMHKNQLDQIYEAYGFRKSPSSTDSVSIYTYDTGYFHNADIVLSANSEDEGIKKKSEFEAAGYSSQIKKYKNASEAESALFDGFFSIKETKSQLLKQYRDYCKKSELTTGSSYEYIPSRYTEPDVAHSDTLEERPAITEKITALLDKEGPQLIVVEAAAGFGKTTTVHEVIKLISEAEGKRLPFLAELSKNRQAQIFKYVLLDEINRQFPALNLRVITNEIHKGNITLIIDGFDELLGKSEEKDPDALLERTEPMLETISHLLQENAKIILTTRKTALFSGDGFHCWVESHLENFTVSRFAILEPDTEQWVGRERASLLADAGFDLNIVPNPVLLAWIRGLHDSKFSKILENTELIIEEYFKNLLEREKGRQDLTATIQEQNSVFLDLAGYFIKEESTTDTKDKIERCILESSSTLIKSLRQRYPSDSRPTEEQIVEKLSLHALLDRKMNGAIGFVNDFVFGFFIGESIIHQSDNEIIIEDERFIDYAVTAFRNRSSSSKQKLWELINFYIDLLSSPRKFQADFYLTGKILREYNGENFDEQHFEKCHLGELQKISTTTFSNCVFNQCTFDFSNIHQSYFLSCRFYNSKGLNLNTDDLFFGCIMDGCEGFEAPQEVTASTPENSTLWEQHVLNKIWPTGAPRLATRRAITTIKMGISPDQAKHVEEAIELLKKKGILTSSNGTVAVDISKINQIKRMLGRT